MLVTRNILTERKNGHLYPVCQVCNQCVNKCRSIKTSHQKSKIKNKTKQGRLFNTHDKLGGVNTYICNWRKSKQIQQSKNKTSAPKLVTDREKILKEDTGKCATQLFHYSWTLTRNITDSSSGTLSIRKAWIQIIMMFEKNSTWNSESMNSSFISKRWSIFFLRQFVTSSV